MAVFRCPILAFALTLGISGCSTPSSPGVPVPIRVLENPDSGKRVRLYKEIPFKVPDGYDEEKHIAEWTEKQKEAGFTKVIAPEDDRKRLAELRKRNLKESNQSGDHN
mgnify:CR=1 FL=1